MTHTEVYKQYHIDPPQHRHSHTGLHTPTIRVLAFLPPQSTSRSLSDSHPSANSSSCCRPCCSAGIELQHDKNTVSLVVPADVLTVPVAGQSHDDVPAPARGFQDPRARTCFRPLDRLCRARRVNARLEKHRGGGFWVYDPGNALAIASHLIALSVLAASAATIHALGFLYDKQKPSIPIGSP